jgi:hypothetical protein
MKKYIITITILILVCVCVRVAYAALTATEGLAIDLSSAGPGTDMTIDFDPTELTGNRSFNDGATDASFVWTFDLNAGTDPTFTFADGLVTFNTAITSGGTITGSGTFDVTGANPMVLGSADVTSFTVTTDGTGNAEFTLPNDVIGDADIDFGSGAGQVDLADIPGGTAGANAFDFGGATSIEIVNGTDPDVDAAGEIAFDTDGANITNDAYYRGYDGSNQFAFGHKLKWIQGTVILPNDLADGERDALCIFKNKTGTTITIVAWDMESGTDDTTLNIEETDADGQNNSTVDAVEIATDGTGIYYGSDTTITAGTIETEHRVLLDFDDTDTPDYVKFSIGYWENADVD